MVDKQSINHRYFIPVLIAVLTINADLSCEVKCINLAKE